MAHKQLVEVCNFINTAKAIDVPLCDTSVNVEVDSLVAAYVLNPNHRHTERIYVNATASLSGTFTTIITGTSVSFDFGAIVATNWTSPVSYAVEFGNGYTDLGGTPSFNFANEPDGHYTLKVYRAIRFADNDKYVLIGEVEIDKVGSTITIATTNPVGVGRNITYTVAEGLQDYCDNVPFGSPYSINGAVVTAPAGGSLSLTRYEIENEWLGQTDANNPGGSSATVTAVTPVYSSNRTLLTANTTPAAYNVAAIANSREITVQNVTASDVTVTTSQGTQIVAARSTIVMSNPKDTTIDHNIFTGNIVISFFNSVGGNYLGAAPRVIVCQKGWI